MKLTFEQKTWIRNYELAKANGVTFDANTQEYIPFDEIVIPEWYEDWLEFLDKSNNTNENTTEEPAKEKHEFPTMINASSIAKILGTSGGRKRAEILSKERRSEIARMGGLAKGKHKK